MAFNHDKALSALADFKNEQTSSNEINLKFLEGLSAIIANDFLEEEMAMSNEDYLLYDFHVTLHNDFKKILESLVIRVKAAPEALDLKEKIIFSCENWFEKHIKEENEAFSLFCNIEKLMTDIDFEGCTLEVLQNNNNMMGTGAVSLITDKKIVIKNKGQSPLPALPNDILKLNVFSPKKGFKVWECRCVSSDINELIVVNVVLLTEGNKRTFFRVKTDIRAKLEVVDEERSMMILDPMNLIVTVLDISIGGLMFETDQVFELGDQVLINLELYRELTKLECVVVRAVKRNGCYEYGCKFFDYSLRQGDMLAKFVVDHQRAMALRGR